MEMMKMKNNEIYLVWLDFETGGLNGRLPNEKLGMEFYPILEVALIVTDSKLNQVGESLRLVIHHSEARLAECSEWALDTHNKSGLIDEVRSSKLSLNDAEHAIISHLQTLGINSYDRKKKAGAILAGSSIMFDRTFMMCQMPELNDYIHYRQLDVSAFNLAVRMFKPEIEERVNKEYKHEALADIQETIDEFKVYSEDLFEYSKYKNITWKYDRVEECEMAQLKGWFLSAREIREGFISLILTQAGFANQHHSVIAKSDNFKVSALDWAYGLIKHHELLEIA